MFNKKKGEKMLKLLKGLDQPVTIINTDLIKFVQLTKSWR